RDIEKRKNLARDLHQQPGHHAVSDRNFVDVASLQFAEEFSCVHCARLYQALVTAAFYLYAPDLKSACHVPNRGSDSVTRSLPKGPTRCPPPRCFRFPAGDTETRRLLGCSGPPCHC